MICNIISNQMQGSSVHVSFLLPLTSSVDVDLLSELVALGNSSFEDSWAKGSNSVPLRVVA